jgi:hypothetical protein
MSNVALIDRVPHVHDEAAMRGRPKTELVLTEDEHEQLTASCSEMSSLRSADGRKTGALQGAGSVM